MRNSVFLVVGLAAAASAAQNPEAALERAVQTELTRAKRELKDEAYPGIYHAALTVSDIDEWHLWSAMGAPRAEARMSQRTDLPDVRVGSAALDNHPDTPRADDQAAPLPQGGDEFALRRALWLSLDSAYKTASADFLRKQEQLVAKGRAEYDTDDLAPEPPSVSTAVRAASPWDLDRLRRLEEALSDPLRAAPFLLTGDTRADLRRIWTRRRDTDGTAVDKADDLARLQIDATAISPDGLRESLSRQWLARAPEALPTEAELRRAGRELVAELKDLRVAVTTSPFSAPALLDPSVSSALTFALGQRLSGEEQRNPSGAQTFRGRVGEKVLDESLTLADDPSQAVFRGRPLLGHYAFDDEGVPARRALLIERGILRGFLLSRFPVKGFPRSNGHARGAIGVMPAGAPANLFLSSADPRPVADLLERLRALCRNAGKPYGLWVKRLRAMVQQQGGGAQGSIRFAAQIVLVPADGAKPFPARDLDLVGTPLVMAESARAAGDDAEAQDIEWNGVAASVAAPSLLLAEAELQRSDAKPEKGPQLPPPLPFAPEPGAPPRRAPASAAFLEVVRYLIAGQSKPIEALDVDGVAAWRQTRTPEGLVVDAKLSGADAKAVTAVGRRLAAAMAALNNGGVHKTVLWAARPIAAYRSRYEDGWPDEGPR